jgi:transcriptional regulator with XRE-family HTH domain
MELNREKIKQLMAARGWSESNAAARMGMASQQFNSLMRNDGAPTLKTIDRIARLFGVPAKSLIRE